MADPIRCLYCRPDARGSLARYKVTFQNEYPTYVCGAHIAAVAMIGTTVGKATHAVFTRLR